MEYTGTYTCGHEGSIVLHGSRKERNWRCEKEFSGLCPDCYIKSLEADNLQKAKKAQADGMVVLAGSAKQVHWANQIRDNMIEHIDEALDCLHSAVDRAENDSKFMEHYDMLMETRFLLTQITGAKWFIDCSEFSPMREVSVKRMLSRLRLLFGLRPEDNANEVLKEKPARVDDNTILRPENCTHDGWVELTITRNTVNARYENDETFKKIVKSNGLSWDSSTYMWRLSVGEMEGSNVDCVAELASKLLASGFAVSIPDDEAWHKTITGDYIPRSYRWISESCGEYIIHYPKADSIADTAVRRIIGYCKWDGFKRGFRASRTKTKSIRDLVRLYDFRMSADAQNLANNFETAMDAATMVEPVVRNNDGRDGLRDILDSSRDILDDLKDDI